MFTRPLRSTPKTPGERGTLKAILSKEGRSLGTLDVQIAGMWLTREEFLLTGDRALSRLGHGAEPGHTPGLKEGSSITDWHPSNSDLRESCRPYDNLRDSEPGMYSERSVGQYTRYLD